MRYKTFLKLFVVFFRRLSPTIKVTFYYLLISIIYFFIVFLLKPLKRVKFGAEIQLLVVLSILWLFALLTGLPASVTRAVTLFSFISIGTYFNQPKAIYNALAISAFLILL